MIKIIVFDIDNTLLDTDKDCYDCYKNYFKDHNLLGYDKEIFKAIDLYDSLNRSYEKEDLINFVNSKVNINITREEFDNIFNSYEEYATLMNKDIPYVLEELSKKYELVALSKWYVKNQEARLKKANILKYFKKVYGIENAGIKPEEKSFLTAIGKFKCEEALVVGDSIENDIIVPLKLNMRAIYYNHKKEKVDYESIDNLKELLDILK